MFYSTVLVIYDDNVSTSDAVAVIEQLDALLKLSCLRNYIAQPLLTTTTSTTTSPHTGKLLLPVLTLQANQQ